MVQISDLVGALQRIPRTRCAPYPVCQDDAPWIAEHDAPVAQPIDVTWIHGSVSSKHNTDPDVQVFWYDADTVILRQNKAIDYEAPFMFLLFGHSRVLSLRTIVDDLIDSWRERNACGGIHYELLVLHRHSHGDHVAGDTSSPIGPKPR